MEDRQEDGPLARVLQSMRQLNEGRLFLWLPVALAVGIAVYFSIPREPTSAETALAAIIGVLFLAGALRPQRAVMTGVLLVMAWPMIGFSAASWRTMVVSTPILSAPISADIAGVVIDVQPMMAGAQRLLIAPSEMSRLPQKSWPKLVRVKLRASQVNRDVVPGREISFSARLMPLPQPVAPGGFDFARSLFFDGIGAIGFAYSRPLLKEDMHERSFQIVLNQMRGVIAARIFAQIDDEQQSAIAVALLTGYRGAIPEQETAALRGAGLAHLLAISGLHLGLVSGTVYLLVRFLCACIPGIALNYPVRKWAASAALVVAILYFLLSGMSVPTMRAMIMTGIVLCAVMLDRQPISMRLVAIAAFGVLLITPESLLGAGFHMSFAAVLGLVATYEALREHRGRMWRLLVRRDITGYGVGLITTSVVAGSATALIAAFHFNRFAQFGLLGNVFAVPLTGLLIMPAGLMALVAMPFGLEALPLQAMGYGIEGVLAVAHTVSALRGAEAAVHSGPGYVLLLVTGGGLVLLLVRGKGRVLGVLPILVALLIWESAPRPDILIDRELKVVGVRNQAGDLVYSSNRSARFVRENWQRSDGENSRPATTASCDRYGCIFDDAWGNKVSYARTLAAAMEDCARVDVLIVQEFVGKEVCAGALLIDLGMARRKGAMALYWNSDADRYNLKQAAPAKEARRPWHPGDDQWAPRKW